MNKNIKKTIAMASIVGIVASSGFALADYSSQYSKSQSLINQLVNIAERNQSNASNSNQLANSYMTKLRSVYEFMGEYGLSDEQLASKTDMQIYNDLNSYMTSYSSGVSSNEVSMKEQEIARKLAQILGANEDNANVSDMISQVQQLKSNYNASIQQNSSMSMAVSDMQNTIEYLEQQIVNLGEKPCTK